MQPRVVQLGGTTVTLRPATVAELVPLRHRILRAGLPIGEAHFDGDAEPTSRHAGAFLDGRAISCATLVLNAWEGEPAWQLRGMASDDGYRGTGAGTALLEFLTEWAVSEPPAIRLFWCNARVPALKFYEKQGWQVASEQFDIPTAGPHRKMVRRA